jgi:hypothetical protein
MPPMTWIIQSPAVFGFPKLNMGNSSTSSTEDALPHKVAWDNAVCLPDVRLSRSAPFQSLACRSLIVAPGCGQHQDRPPVFIG